MTEDPTAGSEGQPQRSSLGDRLRFVIWLAALRLGVQDQKDFAAAIERSPTQLSTWLAEKPRPAFETIRLIAGAVDISAAWLDDPMSRDAREPELWPQWYAARLERLRELAAQEAARPLSGAALLNAALREQAEVIAAEIGGRVKPKGMPYEQRIAAQEAKEKAAREAARGKKKNAG